MLFYVFINMKIYISVILATFISLVAYADVIGQWQLYQSYSQITQVCPQIPGQLYWVLASDHLYQYSVNDSTSYLYSRDQGLSDNAIAHIAWNAEAECLLVAYCNCNIDILRADGSQVNIMDYMNKSVTGVKDVTGIVTLGPMFYILTSAQGIIEVNPLQGYVSDILVPGTPRYQQVIAIPQPPLVIPECLRDFVPAGPLYDDIFHSAFAGNKFLSVRGGYNCSHFHGSDMYYLKNSHGMVQALSLDSGTWSLFSDTFAVSVPYRDNNVIAVDPLDDTHVAVGGRDGVFIFSNGMLFASYNHTNSPLVLQGALEGALVTGLTFDARGNLYVANSLVSGPQLFCLSPDGTWSSPFDIRPFMPSSFKDYYRGLSSLNFDASGRLWLVNDDFPYNGSEPRPAILCCDPQSGKVVYANTKSVNQNGTTISSDFITRCLLQAHDGTIWVGTSGGPIYISPSQVERQDMTLNQHVVPRNDGSGLGDYLLAGVDVYCMAEDGKGRLWVGTRDNGVYLISADRNQELAHYTSQNSLLPDNTINSISIHPVTGLVFFCTELGIASLQSDASQGADHVSDLYCYPNPVRPEYTGPLTITGLVDGAIVSITDAMNCPVFRSTAIGGTITWDMRLSSGSRLSPGIYFVYQHIASKGNMFKLLVF